MISKNVLSIVAFALVATGVWYYTKYVEPDGPRSKRKQSAIAMTIITIIVVGEDLLAFTPLRAVLAIALGFLVGHTVESVSPKKVRK